MKNSDKKLILHIGLPETGSEVIQNFLRSNEEALAHQNIFYPRPFMAPFAEMEEMKWHPSLVAYIASELSVDAKPAYLSPFLRNAFNIGSNHDAKVFQRSFRRRFKRYLAAKKSGTVILSGDQLSTSLREAEHFGLLKGFIDEHFSELKIVVYLKAQEQLLNTRFADSIILGVPSTYEALKNAMSNDYYELLKPWWECFGKGKIEVRIMDQAHLQGGDLISDFFHIIGGEKLSDFERPSREKSELSNQAIFFLQRLNELDFLAASPEGQDEDKNDLDETLALFSKNKHGLLISADQMREIRETYHSSNEKLKNLFFPDRAELFPIKIMKESVRDELTSQSAIEISAFLWEQQQKKIRSLQKQIKRLRRALAQSSDNA